MNLRLFVLVVVLVSVKTVQAFASIDKATHFGKVDVKLEWVDAKGKKAEVAEETGGGFLLNWNNKKCNFEVKNGSNNRYAYCELDLTQDLLAENGDLIMKAMPQVRFDAKTVGDLFKILGKREKKLLPLMDKMIADSENALSAGLSIPFYTCGDCSNAGKDLMLFDAFVSFVERKVELTHKLLPGQKLILSVKLKKLEALRGNLDIIGNNSQGNL